MRYRDEGAADLVSRRRGTRSNHHLPQTVLDRALGLIDERYAGRSAPRFNCHTRSLFHFLVTTPESGGDAAPVNPVCARCLIVPKAEEGDTAFEYQMAVLRRAAYEGAPPVKATVGAHVSHAGSSRLHHSQSNTM